MNILGINAYHGDSAAAISKNGNLIAAAEEERFTREKHWAGVPINAIKYCLQVADIKISQVDYIVLSKNPFAHILDKIHTAILKSPFNILNRINANVNILTIRDYLNRALKGQSRIKPRIVYVEHHKAHIADAYYSSPFRDALILSCDGAGDMRTAMWALGQGDRIDMKGSIRFPHSLGFLYTAFTQFLGFLEYGDEYKVMGLAPYGRPNYTKEINEIVRIKKDGSFTLDLSYFNINKESVSMTWMNCRPNIGRLYSDKFIRYFGKPRLPGAPLDNFHKDIASSLQTVAEQIILNLLTNLKSRYKQKNLCLSGGIFANSVICGKISDLKVFDRIYVSYAPGDAGTAIGALTYFYNKKTRKRIRNTYNVFNGPMYDRQNIIEAIEASALNYEELSEDKMLDFVIGALIDKKIVGWFQGNMEFGYRALGDRSILAHPGYSEMRDILNIRIKNRESFRPFAPSVMKEHAAEFFHVNDDSPYMSFVAKVKEDKIDRVKAVTHVDNTSRVQTVAKEDNPLFYSLLERFYGKTGLPLLLNTSFNENEPMVNTPKEAIDCFLRTKMDILILGDFIIKGVKKGLTG